MKRLQSLTEILPRARKKYCAGFEKLYPDAESLWHAVHSIHLRELPDGRKQVIRYWAKEAPVPRDSTGVQVLAETTGDWNEIL